MTRARQVRYGIVFGFAALLEFVCRAGLVRKQVVIPPTDMFRSLAEQVWAGHVFAGVLHSLVSIGLAFASAVAVGVTAGLAIHGFPRLRRGLDPFFATYYAVPFFIFYPVLLSIFGVSRLPIVLMAFAFAVVAVILATLTALDRQPRILAKIGAVHHMSWPKSLLLLSLPAALPHLFTGVKLAVAYSFIGVLACEFLLSSEGMGHAISFSYNAFDNHAMYGQILLVIILTVGVNAGLQGIEQYLLRRQGAGTRGLSAPRGASSVSAAVEAMDAILIIVALFAIWQVLHWITGKNAISAPLGTLAMLYDMLAGEKYWIHVEETGRSFALALAIAYGAGVVFGGAVGLRKVAAEAVEPILVSLYSLPKILLLPIVLLFFGIGTGSKIAFGVMHSILPIMLFTIGAVRKIRPIYLKMGKTMHLSPVRTFTRIALPAALPEIVTALRIGFSLTLLGVLVGEMFASKRGLGYLIMNSIGSGDVIITMAVAVFLFTLAGAANALLLHLDRRFLKYA